MKHSAIRYILFAVLAVFLIPQTAAASVDVNISNNNDSSDNSVSVNSQSSGESNTCINGKCTTTGGGSHATVCINGHCTNSDSGNVDMQSDDGHSQVHIHSNTSGNSVTPEASSDQSAISGEPSITPNPTIIQMRKDINDKVHKQTDEVKKHLKSQESAFSAFIKSEMDALQVFLNNLFK